MTDEKQVDIESVSIDDTENVAEQTTNTEISKRFLRPVSDTYNVIV